MLVRFKPRGREDTRLAIAATWPAVSIGAFATGERQVFRAARLPFLYRPQLMAAFAMPEPAPAEQAATRAAREEPKPRKPRKPRTK